MIVYYKKSTKLIMSVCPDDSKKVFKDKDGNLKKEKLEEELDQKFPNDIGDMAVSLFKEKPDQVVRPGGTWDEKKKEMTSPPQPIEPEPTPEQVRMKELHAKFEDQSATLAEVQEYLYMIDAQ